MSAEKKGRHDLTGLNRVLHPQEYWEWPIAMYLYLAGMGAGAFITGLLTDWFIHPGIPSRGLLLWGPILVALGAPFLVLDLGKKLRFINAALNPLSSWAARGFAILSSLMVSGLLSFALAALPDLLPLFDIVTPAWIINQQTLSRTLEIIALVLSFGTAAYTGIFLKSTRYVSLWNTWMLPVLFTFSALSTGVMALIVFLQIFGILASNGAAVNLADMLIPLEVILILLEALAFTWFIMVQRQTGRTPAHVIEHLIKKSSPSLVAGPLLLVIAWFLPSTSKLSGLSLYSALVFLAGIIVMGGGFLLRYDVVKSGIKDQHPLYKMAALQYDWKALAQTDGGKTGIQGEEASHG